MSLINVETMIGAKHPIRAIKRMCDGVLRTMSEHFDEIYATEGAPSIPPETLLKDKILQALYTVRSDRQLCARLQTDLMFRWFVDLPLDEAVFDASSYSKNQQRLLQHAVADLFFTTVVELARHHGWVPDDHFSVDGTLIEAWASLKSFRPKDTEQGTGGGNAWMDFKGQKRRNDTHESTADAEAKLVRKGPGKEARLSFAGHATMENRHGLCVRFAVKPAVGAPESAVAVEQLGELRALGFKPKTGGADKGYHSAEFVTGLGAENGGLNGVKGHDPLGVVPGWPPRAGRVLPHAAEPFLQKPLPDPRALAPFGEELAARGLRLVITARMEDERHRYFALGVKGVPVAELTGYLQRFPRTAPLITGLSVGEALKLAGDCANFSADLAYQENIALAAMLRGKLPSSRLMFGTFTPLVSARAQAGKLSAPGFSPAERRRIGFANAHHFFTRPPCPL